MNDTTSLDTHAHLQDLRLRVLNNERITPDEMRTLLLSIMRDRESAASAAARSRKTAARTLAAPSITLDSLFGENNKS